MALPGLRFETLAPAIQTSPERSDVVAFVGFVRPRASALPRLLQAWRELGWSHLISDPENPPNLPIVLTSLEELDAVLDGEVRTAEGLSWEGYLVGAVRDFFRQGGRRCWVVPAGAPEPDRTPAQALPLLVPGYDGGFEPSAADRSLWQGLTHLFGLPEAAIVSLPDLPGSVGGVTLVQPAEPVDPVPVPGFVECSQPDPAPPPITVFRTPDPMALDTAAWTLWQSVLRHALSWIKAHRSDVQLIAALPLAAGDGAALADPMPALAERLTPVTGGGISSAWLQLCYPWLRTDTSARRPGGLAPPDGVFAGLLARNALARGTFRLATPAVVEGLSRVLPRLERVAVRRHTTLPSSNQQLALCDCVSLMGPTPAGLRLFTDVTTSSLDSWRQGGVNRLVGVVRRMLKRVGETVVFEPNGPDTWRGLRIRLSSALEALTQEGALGGAGDEPYSVACGRSTMTRADLDNGRLIAEIGIRPTLAIQQITVVLSTSASSGVGVSTPGVA